MTGTVAVVALVAWIIGAVVLGRNWQGTPTGSGDWVDGVSLIRWFACWALLAVLAVPAGHRLRGWMARALALLPLTAWIVWQLGRGALGPIPMVIYLVPTFLVWAGALAAGGWARRWRARAT